jgi:hypothetical protein
VISLASALSRPKQVSRQEKWAQHPLQFKSSRVHYADGEQ